MPGSTLGERSFAYMGAGVGPGRRFMSVCRRAILATACAVLASAHGAAASQQAGSAYTRHEYATCPLVEKDAASERRRCIGYAAIPVVWDADDDSTMVSFGEAQSGERLSAAFTAAGRTIEWRGPVEGAGIRPHAAIVRIDVGPTVGGPFRGRLVVFRVGGRATCIVGTVAAGRPHANRDARMLADRDAGSFDCRAGRPRVLD